MVKQQDVCRVMCNNEYVQQVVAGEVASHDFVHRSQAGPLLALLDHVLPCFRASYQATLRFCRRAKLTVKTAGLGSSTLASKMYVYHSKSCKKSGLQNGECS